ncbi:MAG: glycerophosphodiester phosphodiesterase [Desulfobacterales bacterium]|jgi:glycerophosphoryl diester phosphodiesterase|nr:glycerophosphodiester phosphodiesterase [Desulfobacterales bacterium]
MNGSIVKRNLAAATIVTAIALLAFAVPGMAQGPTAAGVSKIPEKLLVIGHRGAAGLIPENTLAAFRRGCELGVDAIELDVLVSADGQLVVHHDFRLKPEIARSADDAWIAPGSQPAVKDLTLAQLKTYDIGRLQPKTTYAARFPEQTPVDGERIPTFKEAIDLFKKSCGPSTRLFVEIKTSPEEPALTLPPEAVSDRVVKMVRDEGIAERTWILSFDWRNLVHIQKAAPELATVYLTIVGPGLNNLQPSRPGASLWMAGLDIDDFNGSAPRAVKAAGGRIWSPFFKNLTPEALAEARQLGLLVSVWTPDNPDDLKKLIEMKVDAITTNRPDVLKKLLADK